ncbi:MAG: PACE efflux transporter [Cellvibrionales bacterium]|nr:PACE efflux transporter [Cellvibrionales bacterium]
MSHTPMSTQERIFHSVLFEIIAFIILTLTGKLISDKPLTHIGGLAITLSFLAMTWNYIFNILFDRAFGYDRINRSLKLRILHIFLFEVGMLIYSLPLFMWVFDIGLIQAFIYDLAAMIFFLFYGFIYNWLYDHIRHWLVHKNG